MRLTRRGLRGGLAARGVNVVHDHATDVDLATRSVSLAGALRCPASG